MEKLGMNPYGGRAEKIVYEDLMRLYGRQVKTWLAENGITGDLYHTAIEGLVEWMSDLPWREVFELAKAYRYWNRRVNELEAKMANDTLRDMMTPAIKFETRKSLAIAKESREAVLEGYLVPGSGQLIG